MIVYNSSLMNSNKLELSLDSQWLQYGRAIFTSGRLVNLQPLFWKEHMDRLRSSIAEILGVSFVEQFDSKFMDEIRSSFTLYKYLPIDKNLDYKFKIYLFTEPGPNNDLRLSFVIHLKKIAETEKNICLQSANNCDFVFAPFMSQFKSVNYLANILLYEKFKSEFCYDVLKLDANKNILECTRSNIFFIMDDNIFTPNLHMVLPGIIRNLLLNSDLNINYNFIEKEIHYHELQKFSGAFISNAVQLCLPVKKIDQFEFSDQSFLCNKLNKALMALNNHL